MQSISGRKRPYSTRRARVHFNVGFGQRASYYRKRKIRARVAPMPAVPPPNPQRKQGSAQRLPSAQPGAAKGAATVIESSPDAGQTVLQPAAGDGAQTVVVDELALEMPVRQEEQKGPQPPRGPRKMPQAVS